MRIKHAISAGVVAVLASLATPALAKHSDAKPADEPAAASSCSAMQQTADGTWQRVPCQGEASPAQAPRKSAARSTEQPTR